MRKFLIVIIGLIVGAIFVFTTTYILYHKRDSPMFFFYIIAIVGSVLWVFYSRRQRKKNLKDGVSHDIKTDYQSSLEIKTPNIPDRNISLLRRTYNKLRQFYNSESDSPLGIAMTFSFVVTMIFFTLIWLIDAFLLGSKFLSLYRQLFGEFNLRVLIIPTIILVVIFSYKFKKYEADK